MPAGAQLRHGIIRLAAGVYEVLGQREYAAPDAERRVFGETIQCVSRTAITARARGNMT